jgi:transposase
MGPITLWQVGGIGGLGHRMAHLDREIHVVLDNLNTHRLKVNRQLQRHPNLHFDYAQMYCSWLNQVEC